MKHFDAIVAGVGGVGSSTLYHLARRGLRVLGLDRYAPGHDRGSSHGKTRLLRHAYFEHPDYVPLVRRALHLWEELSRLRERKLYHETGLIQIGPAAGSVITGVRRSASEHKLKISDLPPREFTKRFPGFHLPPNMDIVFEQNAGYLEVENCIVAYADEAIRLGAELRIGGSVRHWRIKGNHVLVDTESDRFTADRLIITIGPWANDLLEELCIPFEVRRKPQYWYEASDSVYSADKGCPAFLYELPEGTYYGFPVVDRLGVKVAEHTGGSRVVDPLSVDRGLDQQDQKRVETFIGQYLPQVRRRCTFHSVCMYTMSPDKNFVVDLHPGYTNVAFAAGLSGHGFKFSSVLGEVLADLVTTGKTDQPIQFLRCNRPGLMVTDSE